MPCINIFKQHVHPSSVASFSANKIIAVANESFISIVLMIRSTAAVPL